MDGGGWRCWSYVTFIIVSGEKYHRFPFKTRRPLQLRNPGSVTQELLPVAAAASAPDHRITTHAGAAGLAFGLLFSFF